MNTVTTPVQLLILGLLLLFTAPSLAASDDGLQISTQQGDVLGTFSAPTVRQFLGIPYATAKRWQAPVLPPNRTPNIFNASSFSPSCPQLLNAANVEFNRLAWTFGRDNETFVPESEDDCLTVNIWSPSVDRKQSTAVMVWVYGGGSNWGTSRLPIYDGTNLVRDNDDVTLVSFNYRLNIFGQPNAPQLDVPRKPQNFGQLDLDALVQWVHANIANFGGDPERITLFGQSAGAGSIDAYAFSHPNDTIVKGLIQQSGSVHSLNVVRGVPEQAGVLPRINTTTWNTVAALVGCGNAPTTEQFECVKKVPFRTLQDAVTKNNVVFNPVHDEVTFFHDSLGLAKAGKFLNVPILLGATRDESDVFIVAAEVNAVGHSIPTLVEITSDLRTGTFVCPMTTTTLAHQSAGVQVFKYQYQAVFPNLSLRPDMRSFHGSEIHLVFGTYNNSPIASTPSEIEFSKNIQSVWVGFARDPKKGLLDQGWVEYAQGKPSLALLGGSQNETGVVFVDPGPFEGICADEDVLHDSFARFLNFPVTR